METNYDDPAYREAGHVTAAKWYRCRALVSLIAESGGLQMAQ